MNTESVEALIQISHPGFEYEISWFEAEMVMQIEPLSTLPDGVNMEYTISIDNGALSSFGLPMLEDYQITFMVR